MSISKIRPSCLSIHIIILILFPRPLSLFNQYSFPYLSFSSYFCWSSIFHNILSLLQVFYFRFKLVKSIQDKARHFSPSGLVQSYRVVDFTDHVSPVCVHHIPHISLCRGDDPLLFLLPLVRDIVQVHLNG